MGKWNTNAFVLFENSTWTYVFDQWVNYLYCVERSELKTVKNELLFFI